MKYSFDDIVGYSGEVEELRRLCHIFNNRKEFENKGANMPKGVIFYGEPGNGKTLFAKVMADMCDLNVIKIELGNVVNQSSVCKWIKNAFAKARRNKDCTMIFIDEIDKILPDESEYYTSSISKTVLAQLLTQIDGLDSANNVVVVATCNNYFNLPSSFVRPGRIDKKIKLSYPDFDSRIKLIKFYQSKTTCKFEIEIAEIAKLTTGLSCSAIASFINECVLRSDIDGFVSKDKVYNCILEIKNEDIPRTVSSEQDKLFACRNLGAFIVSKNYNDGNYMLSLDNDTVCNDFFNGIISCFDEDYPCGNDSDDYDEEYEEDDDDENDDDENSTSDSVYYSKDDYLNSICALFGGYVAEELILENIYDNVGYQLSLVDDIIRDMMFQGMFGIEYHFNAERGKEMSYTYEQMEKFNEIFMQVRNDCYERAKKIVAENKKLIVDLIPILIEKRNIDNVVGDSIIDDLGGMKKIAFVSSLR